uniref:Poly [ADP-ribose] polymerase n=1 Tax=Canis lupus familiaris TaxID=9615 RepID=A0A8C0RLR7_CANLF
MSLQALFRRGPQRRVLLTTPRLRGQRPEQCSEFCKKQRREVSRFSDPGVSAGVHALWLWDLGPAVQPSGAQFPGCSPAPCAQSVSEGTGSGGRPRVVAIPREEPSSSATANPRVGQTAPGSAPTPRLWQEGARPRGRIPRAHLAALPPPHPSRRGRGGLAGPPAGGAGRGGAGGGAERRAARGAVGGARGRGGSRPGGRAPRARPRGWRGAGGAGASAGRGGAGGGAGRHRPRGSLARRGEGLLPASLGVPPRTPAPAEDACQRVPAAVVSSHVIAPPPGLGQPPPHGAHYPQPPPALAPGPGRAPLLHRPVSPAEASRQHALTRHPSASLHLGPGNPGPLGPSSLGSAGPSPRRLPGDAPPPGMQPAGWAAVREAAARDVLAADLRCSLFASALQSYKRDSALRPFPAAYARHDCKDFEALLADASKLPNLNELLQSSGDKDLRARDLVSWILSSKVLTVHSAGKSEFEKIQKLTGAPHTPVPVPDFLFEIEYSNPANAKFYETKGERDLIYAFHGSRLENFHSIIHNGLHCHLNKTSLFGEGTYLTSDLSLALIYSPHGLGWQRSLLGPILSCVAVCEVIDHPDVKCQMKKKDSKEIDRRRARIKHSEGGDVPPKYFVVTNNQLLRVRYLLVYSQKQPSRASSQLSWFSSHWFTVMLSLYLLLLLIFSQIHKQPSAVAVSSLP